MSDLTFDRVSKRYLVRRESDGDETLHPWLRKLRALRRKPDEFWALRDVSFDVERGETLGIIGHNGAGKSTILKLLSNITSPTAGRIAINGRLSALIEVGSGFHPELTGRENIFLNGAILGMRRSEIAEKLDSITEFAGVRPFLDVPVKRFSSGMYVRLGFSIAAHLDPDILLLDEVLAVGDAAFQEKCLTRIGELKRRGTTIVFISHDLAAVERICDRVILMRRGEIAANGMPATVISQYEHQADTSTINASATAVADDSAEVTGLTFRNTEGSPARSFHTGGNLQARIEFVARQVIPDAVFDIVIVTPDREVACQLSTETSGHPICVAPGSGSLTFSCDELGLLPGIYYADVSVKHRGAPEAIHWQYAAAMLRVDPGKVARGAFYQAARWRLESEAAKPRITPTEGSPIRPMRSVGRG
jgi:ABC-type polysaccharide/polyol phosphate transport system ATPase subunit